MRWRGAEVRDQMTIAEHTLLALCVLTASCGSTSASDAGTRDLGRSDLGRDLGEPDLSLADLSACVAPSRDLSTCPGDGSVGVPIDRPCDGFTRRMCAHYDAPGGCYPGHIACTPRPPEDGGSPVSGSLCVAASTDVGAFAEQRCGDSSACPNSQICMADRPGGRPFCACRGTSGGSPTDAGAPDPGCAAVTGGAASCPGTAPAFVGVGPRECDEYSRAQCLRWAFTEGAGCTRAVAQCTNASVGTVGGPLIECVRADHCDGASVDSCACGASAPCNDGQVCVVDTDGIARCHCAAVPAP